MDQPPDRSPLAMPVESLHWHDCLEIASASDVGMQRANNQDANAAVLARDEPSWQLRGHVLIVADGMGAHAAGELASQLAVDNIPHTYYKSADLAAADAIRTSILEANTLIHSRGQSSPDFLGMGTTCSTLVLLPQSAVVAHVGDSRVYRLRQMRLEQLSFDHSLVWEMIEAGQIDQAHVPDFIPRNVITRSLGPNARVEVDLEGPFPLEVDDTFLMCSDGLTGPVDDEEIGALLGSLRLEDAVQTLLDLANLRGGPDNITAIAARITAPLAMRRRKSGRDLGTARNACSILALWGAAGMLLLGSCVLAVLGQIIAAVAAACGALAAAGAALVGRLSKPHTHATEADGGPLGKAPYRSFDCHLDAAIVERFADSVTQLREATTKDGWDIDWQRFDGFCEAGKSAAAEQEYVPAIAEYAHAIRFMLSELRALKRKQSEADGTGGLVI